MNTGVIFLALAFLAVYTSSGTSEAREVSADDHDKLEKILLELQSKLQSDSLSGKHSGEKFQSGRETGPEKQLEEVFADDSSIADDKSKKDGEKNEEELEKLSLNFDDIAQGKEITFKDVRLNTKADIKMAGKEKATFLSDLQEYLHGQTLEQRMKVWEGMAELQDKVLQKKGTVAKKELNTFNVEDNDLFEGDIVLDSKNVHDLEDSLEQEQLADDPNAILKKNARELVKKLTTSDLSPKEKSILGSLRKLEKHVHSNEYKEAARKRDFLDGGGFSEDEALSDTLMTVLLSTAKDMDARDDRSTDAIEKKMFTENKWDMPIHYVFDGTHNEEERRIIHLGVQLWENSTCVTFKYVANTDHKPGQSILFHKGSGCSSEVGEKSEGNEITLGKGCFLPARVAHEIGHALGFWHEQSRPDRDRYVNINMNKLKDEKFEVNFLKMSWKMEDPKGVEYDLSSVMHYGGTYFKDKDAAGFTTETKDPEMQKAIGQRFYLSFLNVKAVNYRYCADICGESSLEWDKCKNEGYRDPKKCDQCRCPQGWTGQYCQDVDSGSCINSQLTATPEAKYLTSPGYHDNGYALGQYCAWLITAPEGMRVVAKFVDEFAIRSDSQMDCSHPFCQDWVEVRYDSLAKTGPRFCCEEAPEHEFLSSGNKMMILFKSFLGDRIKGFKLLYKAERCGGCGEHKKDLERTCTKSVKYDCSGKYYVKCGVLKWARCERKRLDYCFKEEDYCCEGYKKVGQHCISNHARLELNELLRDLE